MADMDPNAVAERELHAAARAIEMAAKKIAGLKPKTKQKSEAELVRAGGGVYEL